MSSERSLVREGRPFDTGIGIGLYGASAKNEDGYFFNQAAERAEIKKDFDAGVIPFYLYDYDSGHVTHNGIKIYHGQTLEQAMATMLERFGGG